MRKPPGRGSIAASKANSRLGTVVLALAVAASIALGAGAVRVFTLPLAPEATPAPQPTPALAATTPALPSPAAASVPAMGSSAGAAAVAQLPAQRHSERRDQNVGSQRGGQGDRELSPSQVVALARRRYRARVVRNTTQQDSNGRPLYALRLLSAAGRVWTVRIDAHSGAEIP